LPGNTNNTDHTPSNVSNKFDDAVGVFDTFGGNFKDELAKSCKKDMKSEALDVYVSNPFRNAQTKQTHYVVIYGFFGKAWALKASFLRTYLQVLAKKMNSVKGSKVDINHCHSYYEINTRKHEFGSESVWRRLSPKNGKKGNTIKRMSFVLSFDTVHNNLGIDKVKDAVEFFMFSMKKRESNQVGELLLDHLKDHAVGLYDHLLSGTGDVESVEKKLTDDINSHFTGGYSISRQNPLNRFMVDYDIIRILKEYVGYTAWSEVPMTERGYCFRGYNAKSVLPEWDLEEETYNN